MASISSLGVGSGLDLSGLLEQLRDAERQKLQPITAQQTQEKARISAYGRLQSGLDKLQEAVATLNGGTLFQGLSANVLGEGMTATTSAEASPGRYEVAVTHTARAGSLASTGVADLETTQIAADAIDPKLTVTFGDDTTKDIALTPGATLEEIRDAVNADAEAGVDASIIFDGTDHRLVLSSRESGADAGVKDMAFSGLAGGVTLAGDPDTHQPGRDALLDINGIAITSATNTVEGAIQGVTLTLDPSASGKTMSLVVERDRESVKEAVTAFVDAYNELKSTLGRLTKVTGDADTAGELVGDRTVRSIESRLSRSLTEPVLGGELEILSAVGISLNEKGRLELDEGKLDDAIASNPLGVADFFAGADKESGLAGRLQTSLGLMLDHDGMVPRAIDSSEARKDRLGERYERMELSIERTIERYRKKFSQLDGMLAQMNAMSAYLGQQFDMLAQMTQKK